MKQKFWIRISKLLFPEFSISPSGSYDLTLVTKDVTNIDVGDKISVQAPIFESSDFFTPEFIEENRALGIGREWFKSNRIGSDGFIQLSYQIAFRLIRNDPVSVYESCGTAAFKHGRTETIRPVTKESDDLILAYIKVCNTLVHMICSI